MKIAIHHRQGSFSDRWIAYCKKQNIGYKTVNAFDSDIIEQVKDCDVFMWHHHHAQYKDVLTAKRILFALEHAGVKVFPDFKTGWHFDDKIAETYLLQAIGAPIVPSYIFYNKKEALSWASKTSYPKVFKLKAGASGSNVRLVKTEQDARRLIRKAFGKGFKYFDGIDYFKERHRKFKNKRISILSLLKSSLRLIIPTRFSKLVGREVGYVYFQEFIENEGFDTRVIVINGRAFAMKNMVRENDFRASNSGNFIFDKSEIDERCVKLAFDTQKRIGSQSTGFDIVIDESETPYIIEMGYGFIANIYDSCPGYWDTDLNWHEEKFNPQEWMVQNLIDQIKAEKNATA